MASVKLQTGVYMYKSDLIEIVNSLCTRSHWCHRTLHLQLPIPADDVHIT